MLNEVHCIPVYLPISFITTTSRQQDKILSFHVKMNRDGIDLNTVIQQRKDFRNPRFYYTYTHMHTYMCTYTHICTYTYTHIHIHAHTHMCTYTHMHTHVCVHTHTCTHICVYIHTHIHTLSYTHKFTHTLTHLFIKSDKYIIYL